MERARNVINLEDVKNETLGQPVQDYLTGKALIEIYERLAAIPRNDVRDIMLEAWHTAAGRVLIQTFSG